MYESEAYVITRKRINGKPIIAIQTMNEDERKYTIGSFEK
jgi:hypothetical protein